MSLRVLEPGVCSLIVDDGRPRTRSLGVPPGGPADRSSFALGNAMLGNAPNTAALEMTLAGPVVQALHSTAVVVFGAPFSLSSARQRVSCNHSFTLDPGEELHIGGTKHGARAYLCVAGGFQTASILGSRSSLEPLPRGFELPCIESSTKARLFHEQFDWPVVPALSRQLAVKERVLRVLPGPEADLFPGHGQELFQSGPTRAFTVRPESNRMGLRLAGDPLPVPAVELVSQPVAPGALQVTREGQLILIGVDGQTIGGYPRIGHVISADLDAVGQLRPGDQISFQPITLEEAEQANRDKFALLQRWCLRLRTAVC